jgi:hypothetical protein
MQPDFKAALAAARVWEARMATWLRSHGYLILPTYDYTGIGGDKAPRLEAERATDSLVLPDLLVAKGGRSFFVEVKVKARADWTRVSEQLETGLDGRLWSHYLRVEEATGLPVWLAFLHQKEGLVLCNSLAELRPLARSYDGGRMGRKEMVFFPFDELRRIANLDELIASEAA